MAKNAGSGVSSNRSGAADNSHREPSGILLEALSVSAAYDVALKAGMSSRPGVTVNDSRVCGANSRARWQAAQRAVVRQRPDHGVRQASGGNSPELAVLPTRGLRGESGGRVSAMQGGVMMTALLMVLVIAARG